MESNYITKKEFDGIMQRLDEINQKVSDNQKKIEWVDNADFLQIMKISRRCGQHYRDSNLIAYSIIGNKIWYKLSDVTELLERHYRKRLV